MSTRSIEVCILAGGLSHRMGRDKSRVRLGGRSLLAHARSLAQATGFPMRVLRRDLVPQCGPIGGIWTALETTRAHLVLFLSCDMPFVTPGTLRMLMRRTGPEVDAVFVECGGIAGFPFLVSRGAAARIRRQLMSRARSLQALARVLTSKRLRIPAARVWEFLNVNTPGDLEQARRLWRERPPLHHPGPRRATSVSGRPGPPPSNRLVRRPSRL